MVVVVGSSIDSCVVDGSENTRKGKVKKKEEKKRRRRSKRQKRWKESFYLFAVGIGIGFAACSSSFPPPCREFGLAIVYRSLCSTQRNQQRTKGSAFFLDNTAQCYLKAFGVLQSKLGNQRSCGAPPISDDRAQSGKGPLKPPTLPLSLSRSPKDKKKGRKKQEIGS